MSCKIQTALVVLILCGLAVAPPPPPKSSQRYCSNISPFGGSCNAGYGNGNGNCDYCPERQKCCLVKTEGDGVNAGLDHCPIGCCIDPPNCWDMNECEGDDGMTVCGGANQICVNTIGSYKCTCTAGFAFAESDSSCKNINECDLTEAVCTGDHEKCVDTVGSYSCDCKDNYRRDVSTDPCLALWVTGSWGTCMATPNCGTGTQIRDVTCPTAPDTECYGSMPVGSQDCCTGITCPAWITSSWSDCPSCGIDVMRERTVSCVGGATLDVLDDNQCSGSTKPTPSSQLCSLSPCDWKPSDESGWSACSATACCDTAGTQQRTVYCHDTTNGVNIDDSQCTAANKPLDEQSCDDADYLCDAEWISLPWSQCDVKCGTGKQQRVVFCHDYSCQTATEEDCDPETEPEISQECVTGVSCEPGDKCSPNPCEHCGECTNDGSLRGYECTCHHGYNGDNCQLSGCLEYDDYHECVKDGHGCVLNKPGNSNCRPLNCD